MFVGAGILVALGYAAATLARMPVFESDATLFAHSTAVEPRNPVSPFAAGQAFGARGDVEAKRRFFEVSLDRFLRYRDRPDLFDERSVDAFAAVSTEVALARLQQEPERAIALADLAIEQFGLLRDLRGGRTDSNVTGPYYVKALALRRLGRLDESRVACRAGLALAYHRGLDELLRSLTGR